MRYRAYLFDFDNTLYDTRDSMNAILVRAMPVLGIDYQESDYDRFIGMDLHQIFKVSGGNSSNAEEFACECHKVLDSDAYLSGRMFPETETVLRDLKGQGIALAVVSGKQEYKIESLLRRDGMLDLFDCIVGFDSTERHKPFPDPIVECLHRMGMERHEVLYVGDSDNDIDASLAAGVDHVIVDRDGHIGRDVRRIDSLEGLIRKN